MNGATRKISARAYDLLAALPLIVWYALGLYNLVPRIAVEAGAIDGFVAASLLIAHVSTLLVMLVTIALFVVRRLPAAKAGNNVARLVAIAAANFDLALLALPTVVLPPALAVLSAVLTAVGLLASLAVFAWLGRSFSILPQARGLVLDGPYRYIRHPLYATEFVSSIGVAMVFAQPWSALLTLIGFGLQIVRMNYEEEFLARIYPEYGPYRARTFRLLPGVY